MHNIDTLGHIFIWTSAYFNVIFLRRTFEIYSGYSQERVKQVKYDIYSTITLIHSRKITPESEHEPPYPHLHTLLAFDTQVCQVFGE